MTTRDDGGIDIREALKPSEGRMVFVPDSLSNAINQKLDAAFADQPAAEKDRDALYTQLLAFFDQYGFLPDFTLERIKE